MTTPLDIRHCQNDIQALVASAFSSLRQCHYVFLRVQDPRLARAWIGAQLHAGHIRSVAELGSQRDHQSALALSFTYAGLAALGLTETGDLPFASLFKTGMANASRAPHVPFPARSVSTHAAGRYPPSASRRSAPSSSSVAENACSRSDA